MLLSTHKKPRLSTLSYCTQDYVCMYVIEVLTKTTYFTSSQFFIVSPAYFASSQFFHLLTTIIFPRVTNLFYCIIRNHVSLASNNHSPYTRSYRETLCMYLWYFKKKGVNAGNPGHKNTCQDQICVAATGLCRPKVPTFGCRGDMLSTCWQHSQLRLGAATQPRIPKPCDTLPAMGGQGGNRQED